MHVRSHRYFGRMLEVIGYFGCMLEVIGYFGCMLEVIGYFGRMDCSECVHFVQVAIM